MDPLPVKVSSRSWFFRLFLWQKPKWEGILTETGDSVWLQKYDEEQCRSSLFGKGTLSRGNPTWRARNSQLVDGTNTNTVFLENITAERRKQRRGAKTTTNDDSDVAVQQQQLWSSEELLEMTGGSDYEKLQLDMFEAFFLVYGINTLQIYSNDKVLSIDECWTRFTRILDVDGYCRNIFAVQYAVYHHFRSLGWAPKRGTKFGVDFVLYRPGPRHRHADFAIVVIPPPCTDHPMERDWQSIHRIARVCTQIRKTLLLCYVETESTRCQVPSSPHYLKSLSVQQVFLKRWSPEKNRS